MSRINKHFRFFTGKIIVLTLFAFFPTNLLTVYPAEISVALRYDDFGGSKPSDFERLLIRLCRTYSIPITIGVIPFFAEGDGLNPAGTGEIPLAATNVALIRDLVKSGKVEIAQHGLTHRTVSRDFTSEFHGLSEEQQFSRIERGKKYLEALFGVPIRTFIPPWNRYDRNTLPALEKLSFETLSAGTRSEVTPDTRIKILPATCDLNSLESAVRWAQLQNQDAVITVLFHSYDFKEMDSTLGTLTYSQLEKLFQWLAASSTVRLRTISELSEKQGDLTMGRFGKHKLNWALRNRLPPFLAGSENYFYHDSLEVDNLARTNLLKLLAWCSLVTIGSAIGVRIFAQLSSRWVPKRYAINRRTLLLGLSLWMLLPTAYAYRHVDLDYKELAIAVSTLAVVASSWQLGRSKYHPNPASSRASNFDQQPIYSTLSKS